MRVPVPRLREGEHALGPRVARYLGTVHRLRAGDGFVAFDPEHAVEADGAVIEVGSGELVARIGRLRPARLVTPVEVTWVQGLPKGEKMDGIVRDATELGATRIVPALTTHALVKLEGVRAADRRARWERIAHEAARQCGRGDPPEVLPVTPWDVAVAASAARAGVSLCLHEKATLPLGRALEGRGGEAYAFASGPEGGLSPDEVATAEAAGFTAVSLGPLVLRAETVAAATLGALAAFVAARRDAVDLAGADGAS